MQDVIGQGPQQSLEPKINKPPLDIAALGIPPIAVMALRRHDGPNIIEAPDPNYVEVSLEDQNDKKKKSRRTSFEILTLSLPL